VSPTSPLAQQEDHVDHGISTDPGRPAPFPDTWKAPHLLDLESLTADELVTVLDTAAAFKAATTGCRRKLMALQGRTLAKPVLREFDADPQQLLAGGPASGADTVEFVASAAACRKARPSSTTAKNIEAMNVDVMVLRHSTPGTPHLLAQNVGCAVVNAGDGPHEHPTQGLLDIMTIREHRGRIAGLTVALVGDIAYSRTARSNIWGLKKLGAHVIVCGPSTLVSRHWEEFGVEVAYNLDEILPRCDVLNLLRIHSNGSIRAPSPRSASMRCCLP